MSDVNANTVPVTPKQLGRILQTQIPSGEPLFVWGSPGIGKSELMRQAAGRLGLSIIEIRAPLYKPEDFVGLPWREGNRTKFCPPTFLPEPKGALSGEQEGGVLFIDELGQAEPSTQKVFMQLCLDRRIGEYPLPDGWFVTAASNRATDRAGVSRVITPLLDRFVHFDLMPDVDEWLEWAATAGVPAVVRAFIAFKREALSNFNPAVNDKAFATPRSWVKVGKLVANADPDDLYATVAGKVGVGAAAEFVGFFNLYGKLPSFDEILKKPSTHPLPDPDVPSLAWAVVGGLVDHVAKRDAKAMQQAAIFLLRMDAGFKAFAMRSLVGANRAAIQIKEVREWCNKNLDAMSTK